MRAAASATVTRPVAFAYHHAMSAEAHTLLGRYRLVHRLGQGGMATVWLAEDLVLQRPVALKELIHSPGAIGDQAEMVARLMAEARAAAQLRHPGLVTIHDVVLYDAEPWIVMEYVRGHSLSEEIARNGPLPWQRVAEIGAQVAEAVAVAHRHGIVHRDLKPGNILLTEEGRAVVVDFGIAKAANATSLTSPRNVMGTPEFIAPEILDGQSASPATDMWSLGVTLYMAVEGTSPFRGPELSALLTAIINRSPTPAEHAGPFRELIQALLSKEPVQRPDASAVQQALSSYRPVRVDRAGSTPAADTRGAIASPVPPIPRKRPAAGSSAANADEPFDDGFFDGVTTAVPSPSGNPVGDSTDEADLLFRVYIPKTQLYAEQRREMLRLFRVWLTTVQGQDVRQQDFSTKDGDTVAFYAGPSQLRPLLGEEYREFVSFVEYSAHSPATAIDHLTEIGIDESTSTELVTDYAMKYHRMEMGLRHARQNRLLSLQQTLEGQLLDKGANPHGVAAIHSVQIRSLLNQVVPPPTAAPSLPAIATPGLHQPPTQMTMTFNAEQIIYAAIDNIQGTVNFGSEARQLLALINQYAGAQAGPLLTALHEVEDPGIPANERVTAKKKLTSFLTGLAKRLPDVGIDLLEAYLKRKLGLPDA